MNPAHYIPFEDDGRWWFTTPYGRSAGFIKEQAARRAASYSREQDSIADAARIIRLLIRGNPRNA